MIGGEELREKEAQAAVGRTPIDRLRWLLAFAFRKKPHFGSSEWRTLEREVAIFVAGRRDAWSQPLTERRLRRLTREAYDALASVTDVVREPTHVDTASSWWQRHMWPRDMMMALSLLRDSPVPLVFESSGPVLHRFRGAVLGIMLRAGERLRKCEREECHGIFIKRKRQEFCTPRCGNLVRVRRYRTALRGARLDKTARSLVTVKATTIERAQGPQVISPGRRRSQSRRSSRAPLGVPRAVGLGRGLGRWSQSANGTPNMGRA
jgi:hypothetical protein